MKQQKQIIFVALVACFTASLGFYLGVNQHSDWTLFTLGATLLIAAFCSSVIRLFYKSAAELIPIKIGVKQ
ncbi:hypothetical protein SAMN02745866_00927 [Alteromonadaceae bacterium Bs31]|nr:hypothetical protein SAMN02745866_00927 [Alteromonadaceae bacterium Bs31]